MNSRSTTERSLSLVHCANERSTHARSAGGNMSCASGPTALAARLIVCAASAAAGGAARARATAGTKAGTARREVEAAEEGELRRRRVASADGWPGVSSCCCCAPSSEWSGESAPLAGGSSGASFFGRAVVANCEAGRAAVGFACLPAPDESLPVVNLGSTSLGTAVTEALLRLRLSLSLSSLPLSLSLSLSLSLPLLLSSSADSAASRASCPCMNSGWV